MKYKQAIAAVFRKYRNPRTRSSALGLLERYASATRPVTAWHALGEDAEAARLVLETLGFREKEHFTVQTSVLDPAATRFSWTDAGVQLVAQMSRELAGMRLCEAQRRTLVRDAGDPVACVDDIESLAEAGIDPGYGLVDYVLDRTFGIAKRILDDPEKAARKVPACLFGALQWAKMQTMADKPESAKSPVAPLCVLEALARLEDVPGLPPFPVFSAAGAEFDCGGWSCTRACKMSDVIPSGRINCLPLMEQNGPHGALDGFFAWTADEFRKFPHTGRDATWTQFDARLCRTAEALNFALDAEEMRKFVVKIVEHGYGPSLKAALSGTTRLAVGNTALGGVPGNENLEDDDGDPSSFQYRIEDSAFPVDAPVYMGAFAMAKTLVAGNGNWEPATHPVAIATGDSVEENAGTEGLVAREAAEEWFAIVHGVSLDANYAPLVDHVYEPDNVRRTKRVTNLGKFRQMLAGLTALTQKDRLAEMCSPMNYAFNAHDGAYSVEAAFVQGIGAAMRKYAPEGALQFCESSPYHPEKIIAGVWTGLMTDLAPDLVDDAVAADVFPNISGFPFNLYVNGNAVRKNTTKLLKALRVDPWLQFKFGKRSSKGAHRRHAILIETNVLARPFVEGLVRAGTNGDFALGVWRAFHTSFLVRNAAPLASVDGKFNGYGNCGRSIIGLVEWAAKDVPDWIDAIGKGFGVRDNLGSVDVEWREDELGRLVVMVATARHEIASQAKLAYRYAEHLPLPTAAYLAAHGRANAVVLDKGLSEEGRFNKVLAAAVRQNGFLYNCNSTIAMCGRFGSAWIRELVCDLDSDECPNREWYLDGDSMESVGGYVYRATDNPFADDTPF